jgi:hypothetical protein
MFLVNHRGPTLAHRNHSLRLAVRPQRQASWRCVRPVPSSRHFPSRRREMRRWALKGPIAPRDQSHSLIITHSISHATHATCRERGSDLKKILNEPVNRPTQRYAATIGVPAVQSRLVRSAPFLSPQIRPRSFVQGWNRSIFVPGPDRVNPGSLMDPAQKSKLYNIEARSFQLGMKTIVTLRKHLFDSKSRSLVWQQIDSIH